MASSPSFTVRRSEPVLVAPAEPTTNEFKPLSDIDDQPGLRFQIYTLYFYRNSPSMGGRDPAKVIREALAKALVFYYPLAGRLREGPGKKLFVECTGEGIVFIEAEADARLEQFGDPPRPPFPYWKELIHDVEGSGGILHCPLLLIQVTRLVCGGFIFGLRINHTTCDAPGQFQFLQAVGEMARGAVAPSVPPVWSRELLNARTPPKVTHLHPEFDEVLDVSALPVPHEPMVHRSLFFGASETAALRERVPPHLRTASAFELITACVWRCRTAALLLHPKQEVRTLFTASVRHKFQPPLPAGFYGNTLATPAAVSTAEKLCRSPLGYAVELVKKAKTEVTAEYIQSVADLLVLRGRPPFTTTHSYLASDLTRANLNSLDFGWGMPSFGGPATAALGDSGVESTFYSPSTNKKGEEGILLPLGLPASAMERFVVEIEKMTQRPVGGHNSNADPILSSL